MRTSGLLFLRRRRLAHRAARLLDNLRVYFDFWSTVIYLFALAAFGPGVYLYWRHPPVVPAAGLALLGYWPALALALAWFWLGLQGVFSASARAPLPFSPADLHLLLPSPADRRAVLFERFLTGWWQRFAGPAGLVLLFAFLTAGYGATPWLQVGYLLLAMVPLALGALGLAVAIFSLGPGVARALQWLRRAGQVAGLGAFALSLLAAAGTGTGGTTRTDLPDAGALISSLPPLDLSGAVWPALAFAAVAVLLGWVLAGRSDLALWAGGSPDEAERRSGRRFRSTGGHVTGPYVYAWKYLAAMRKVTIWEWLSQYLLPVAGAVAICLGGRTGGVIAAAFAAVALFRAALFVAGPLARDLDHVSRVRRLPVRLDHFLLGMLAPQAVLLLVPAVLAWLAAGAGPAAVPGALATAVVMAVLAFQHHWAKATALGPAGKVGAGDTSFAYLALMVVVLAGQQALQAAPGLATLAVLSAVAAGGAVALAFKLRMDLYSV